MPPACDVINDEDEQGGLFGSDSEGSLSGKAPPPIWSPGGDSNTNPEEEYSVGLFATPPKEPMITTASSHIYAGGISFGVDRGPFEGDSRKSTDAPLIDDDLGLFSDAGADDQGGLFDSASDSEPVTATASKERGTPLEGGLHEPHKVGDPIAGTADIAWWSLEDACNLVLDARAVSLGSMLSSAEVVSEDVSPSKCLLRLKLKQNCFADAGTSSAEVCEAIHALTRGLQSSMSHDESDDYLVLCLRGSNKQPPDDERAILIRILSHIVDLPLRGCAPQALSRANVPASGGSSSAMPYTLLEMEEFLDDLCRERAELPSKVPEQQQAYRDRMKDVLVAKRVEALEECRELEKRAASARQLTSRDRWLDQNTIEVTSGEDGKSLLAWARKVSELWWSMPQQGERQRFQMEAHIDRFAPGELSRAKHVRDWADELEVFLRNLEPCSQCNNWDPWVENCKRRQSCNRRTCTGCAVIGYCSECSGHAPGIEVTGQSVPF